MGVSGSRLEITELKQENARLEVKIERLAGECTKRKAGAVEMTKWRNTLSERSELNSSQEADSYSERGRTSSFLRSDTSNIFTNTRVILQQEVKRLRGDNQDLQAELKHLKDAGLP